MILALFIGGAFILSSILFTDLIDMMIGRLFNDKTLSDFTTGRTDLWVSYLREFENDPSILFFGKGFTDILVNNCASHNIVIQSIYQFGLPGSFILLIWFFAYARNVLKRIHIKISHIGQGLLLAVGAFGPWLGLDSLKFDEFFIMPFVVFIGLIYTVRCSEDTTVPSGNIGENAANI
jgi:O-antigen ligase